MGREGGQRSHWDKSGVLSKDMGFAPEALGSQFVGALTVKFGELAAGWAVIMVQLQALLGVGTSTEESDRSRLVFCGRAWIRMGTVEAVRPVLGVKPSHTQPELPVGPNAKCKYRDPC